MRKSIGPIIVAVVAAAIGTVWFAKRERDTTTVPVVETPVRRKIAKDVPAKAGRTVDDLVAKTKAMPLSAAKCDKNRSGRSFIVKQEEQLEPAQEEQASPEKKNDNPFPRYLDMFKNNPEALAAEFQKEAEMDRASLAKMREAAIEALKLNAEQVALFENESYDFGA